MILVISLVMAEVSLGLFKVVCKEEKKNFGPLGYLVLFGFVFTRMPLKLGIFQR